MNLILQCKHIEKSFRGRSGEIQILKGIDLSVERGTFVVIFGRSGAGESTLLSILAGLDRPTAGSVIFNGADMRSSSSAQTALLRRNRIGVIFQNFNLISTWTALENVEAALLHRNLSAKKRAPRAASILSDMGLSHRLTSLPSELSIGEQQRIAVARTLAAEPELVLADEPTGSLDPETGSIVLTMLTDHVKKSGATLLVVTHGNFPVSKAQIVYTLDSGRLNNPVTQGSLN